jgi:hypothetical protein
VNTDRNRDEMGQSYKKYNPRYGIQLPIGINGKEMDGE